MANSQPGKQTSKRWFQSKDILWFLVLLFGMAAYFFSSGKFNLPVMAWIWPLFLLVFLHQKKKLGFLFLTGGLMLVLSGIKWYGVAESTFVINVLAGMILGLVSFVPFVLDYVLSDRIRGFKRTFLFPLAFVVCEWLMQLGPMGISGPISATQTGDDVLLQIVSVFGSYGVTFLITWLASVGCFALGQRTVHPVKSLKAGVIYSVVLLAVFAFGGIRLSFADTSASFIQVALTTGPVSDAFLANDFSHLFTLEENISSMKESVRLAKEGYADLLLFSEEAFILNDVDEESMIKATQQAAKENNIVILVTLCVEDTDNSQNGLEDNVAILIDSQGEVVLTYYKNKLVPLMEEGVSHKGDGVIPSATVTFSRGQTAKISAVICMDSDYPVFIRDGLDNDAEILLVPTWDWEEIRAYHSNWVELRAIENGVSLARSTFAGVSTVSDAYGRRILTFDTDDVRSVMVICPVTIQSVFTLYKFIGCVLDWCYVGAFLTLVVIGIIGQKDSQNQRKEE